MIINERLLLHPAMLEKKLNILWDLVIYPGFEPRYEIELVDPDHPRYWVCHVLGSSFEEVAVMSYECGKLLGVPPLIPKANAHTEAAEQSPKPKRDRRKTKPSEATNPERTPRNRPSEAARKRREPPKMKP